MSEGFSEQDPSQSRHTIIMGKMTPKVKAIRGLQSDNIFYRRS